MLFWAHAPNMWLYPLASSTDASWAVVIPRDAYNLWALTIAFNISSNPGAFTIFFFSLSNIAFSSRTPFGSLESGDTVLTTPPSGTS